MSFEVPLGRSLLDLLDPTPIAGGVSILTPVTGPRAGDASGFTTGGAISKKSGSHSGSCLLVGEDWFKNRRSIPDMIGKSEMIQYLEVAEEEIYSEGSVDSPKYKRNGVGFPQ
jgi:hypothetical protein